VSSFPLAHGQKPDGKNINYNKSGRHFEFKSGHLSGKANNLNLEGLMDSFIANEKKANELADQDAKTR
jgi:hypothetical protein